MYSNVKFYLKSCSEYLFICLLFACLVLFLFFIFMVLFARRALKDRRGGEDVMFTKEKKEKPAHTQTANLPT